MKSTASFRWAVLVTANVLAWCMLCLHQKGTAAPPAGSPPFANAVEQRMEMIEQLRQMNALLKEQNTLLRSGTLQVVLAEKP